MGNMSAKLAPLLSGLRQVAPPPVAALRLISKRQRIAEEDTIPPLLPRLVIPMNDCSEDQQVYNQYFAQGQFLSRQESWSELGRLIREFDRQRLLTPGGQPIAEVLAAGARHDAVTAAVNALAEQEPQTAHAVAEDLHEVFDENCADHGVALVVARAHIEIAWAWARNRRMIPLDPVEKGAFHSHFQAAARILGRFDSQALSAPSLAAASCDLLASEAQPKGQVLKAYEPLLALDAATPARLRQFGRHLLPEWFGSYDLLEAQARRAMALTETRWGRGGYFWTYFDALTLDANAFDFMEVDLFLQGMTDVMQRQGDQHTANECAAFLSQFDTSDAAPDRPEKTVGQSLDWILTRHVREIHPLVWMACPETAGRLTPLPEGRAAQKTGRVRAISSLAHHFAPEIRSGHRVIFEPDGVHLMVEP